MEKQEYGLRRISTVCFVVELGAPASVVALLRLELLIMHTAGLIERGHARVVRPHSSSPMCIALLEDADEDGPSLPAVADFAELAMRWTSP